ncbi:MAG: hypothetical protein KF760_23175 [Candidatus Eremiobacteraeota bacterium]|nr:hypothetical protein [Candidatus Eremiobacteraeota bacterium]MCW5870520.1 hypothetical protein [Candidatus Eremiobacteraeota bacterium]
MKITSLPNRPQPTLLKNDQPEPPKPPRNDTTSVTQKIVDATVDKTLAGTDRVSGMLAGMATSTVGYLGKLPSVAAHGARSALNLIQAETIGPNIKVVAGLLSPVILAGATAAAGIGLVGSVLSGAVRGFSAHEADKPRDFTIGKAVDTSWTKVRKTMDNLSTDMLEGSAEIKAKKLAEGEDPWDLPLPPFGRTAKTMAATVAGVLIGGVGGVATAIATMGKEAWNGVKQLSLGGLGAAVASPVTGILHGASKIVTTPIAAAAVAWKEKSLGGAIQAAARESFDTRAGKFASAAGAFVGGALTAVPSAAGAIVTTTFGDLGQGLKTAATDKDLNLGGKGLAALGSVVTAPVAGAVHGAATAIATPFSSAAAAWDKQSLSQGMAQGVPAGRSATRPLANTVGAFAGGLAVGAVSAVTTTGTALVSEVGGGVIDAATNKSLNVRGKILDGIGGIPGDIITAIGEGVGTLAVTPFKAAGAAVEGNSASAGVKAGADYGSKAVVAAANPAKTMVE